MGKRRREVRSGQSAFPQSPAGTSPWTRKSLPSWPQCCAPCMLVKTVTMFQQSYQTKFLRSQKNREPRMEGTAEPWVLEQSAELGPTALSDFHRNGLLMWRKGRLASTRIHCSETLWLTKAERNLFSLWVVRLCFSFNRLPQNGAPEDL